MAHDTDTETDADITENDTQFGRAAARKAERADALVAAGQDPTAEPEGDGADPKPRAGGKASEGAPPAAEIETDAESDQVDSESAESFPASDPPANY